MRDTPECPGAPPPADEPGLHERIVAECAWRAWGATELAQAAGVSPGAARDLLAGSRRSRQVTLARAAAALGLPGPGGVEADETPRAGGAVAGVCGGVDLHAARYSVRRLTECGRMDGMARRLIGDLASALGLPEDWAARALREYEA